MKKISLGIIGCGVIGSTHIQGALAASDKITLAALCDLRETLVREKAATNKVPKAYTNADQLFADPDIEAVVLAIPLDGRPELAVKALQHGKHVLIEKPLVRNVSQARQLLALRGDRVVAACCARFRAAYGSADAITKLIAAGTLGKIRMIRTRALIAGGPPPKNPPPVWRVSKKLNGGGILVNWGVYDLDYLLGLLGWSVRPRTVLAQSWRVPQLFNASVAPGSDAESHYSALIRCDGGEVISLERGEFVAAATDESWTIIGDKASLRLPMLPAVGKKIWLDEATPEGVKSRVVWEGDEDYATIHLPLVRNFAEAILEHRAPWTTLEQAMIVQQITDAIYASAESGQAVTVA